MADRALGNPLGNPLGLARAGSSPDDGSSFFNKPPAIYDFISPGTGEFIVPDGFSLIRVTAVGGGGGGVLDSGGGGGGLSRSAVLPIRPGAPVLFTVGAKGKGNTSPATTTSGGDTSASFLDVSLLAEGGGKASVSSGGRGFGGVDNYTGGAGGRGGGGAAGWDANGGDGASGYPERDAPSVPGLSSGGGGAAYYASSSDYRRPGGGGGGVCAPGGAAANTLSDLGRGAAPIIFGGAGSSGIANSAGQGGVFGGGGGAGRYTSGTSYSGGDGGVGGVRIELW